MTQVTDTAGKNKKGFFLQEEGQDWVCKNRKKLSQIFLFWGFTPADVLVKGVRQLKKDLHVGSRSKSRSRQMQNKIAVK